MANKRKSVICSLPQTQISRFKSETQKEDGGTHHLPSSPSNLDSYSNPFPPPSPLMKSETDDSDASAESSLSARTSGRTPVISISTRYNELNVHNFPAPRPSTIQSCSTFSVQSHRSQQPSPSPVSPLAYSSTVHPPSPSPVSPLAYSSTVQPPSPSPVSPLAYSSTVQPPSPSPVSPPNQTRNPNDQNISISGPFSEVHQSNLILKILSVSELNQSNIQEDDLLDISHYRPPTSPSSNPNIVSVIKQNIKTNVTETPSGEISKYDSASVLKQSMSPPCSPLQQLSIDSSNGTERYKGCIRRGTTTKEFEKVVKKEIKNALKKETEVIEDEGNSSKNEKKKTRFKDRPKCVTCSVCGDKAINHVHYGGLCCYSCKAFFRRAVTSKHQDKISRCRGVGRECRFDKNRKSCPHCRFNACQKIGMKKYLVLSGKEEALKHTGRFKKTKCTAYKTILQFVKQERKTNLQKQVGLAKVDHDEVLQLLECFNVAKTWVITSWAQDTTEKQKISGSAEIVYKVQESFVKMIVLFLKHIEEVKKLDWAAQARLLRMNVAGILILVVASFYNKQTKTFRIPTNINKELNFLEIDETWIKEKAGSEIAREVYQVSSVLTAYDLNLESYLIIICIVLFTREDVQMEKQTKVDLCRNHYCRLLVKYLSSIKNGKKILNSAIKSILTNVRQAAFRLRNQVLADL